jgi:hypothetical protein
VAVRFGAAGGGPRPQRRPHVGAGVGGAQLSHTVFAYLEANPGSGNYLLAAAGPQMTAPIIIETGRSVVTIGGLDGGDPAPTVATREHGRR